VIFKKKRYPATPQCYFCSRFLSYREMSNHSVNWTPYGGSEDEEPPDAEWAHVACWNNQADSRKLFLHNNAWIKPEVRVDANQEYIHELKQTKEGKR